MCRCRPPTAAAPRQVLLKLGNAQWQTAGYQAEEVLRSYQEGRDAALALDQRDEAAEAGIRMSQYLYGSCRHSDVLEIGDNILRGQTDRLRPETLVHLWLMISSAHCHMGDFQQSLAFSQKAIELDDHVNCTHKAPWAGADPAVVARDVVETAARVMGHLDRSMAVAEQGMAIALERGHLFSIVWASVSRILALTSFGCYAEAVACADHALAICENMASIRWCCRDLCWNLMARSPVESGYGVRQPGQIACDRVSGLGSATRRLCAL